MEDQAQEYYADMLSESSSDESDGLGQYMSDSSEWELGMETSSDENIDEGPREGPASSSTSTSGTAHPSGRSKQSRATWRRAYSEATVLDKITATGVRPARSRRQTRAKIKTDFRTGWRETEDFDPDVPAFTGTPGPARDFSRLSPIEIFLLFFTSEIWQLLAEETNRYASQVMHSWDDDRAKPMLDNPTTEAEMKSFVGLILLMGIIRLPRYHLHWSTNDMFQNSFFASVMSRNRFTHLRRFFHLADNTAPHQNNKLVKIEPFLSLLIPKFRSLYVPKKDLIPHESMIKLKGLSFVRHSSKPIEWGIKAWALSESDSGYTWNLKVYTGKEDLLQHAASATTCRVDGASCHPGEGSIHARGKVVLRLVDGLEGRGYRLFCDHLYTSPALLCKLQEFGFGCCGMVHPLSEGLPHDANPKKNAMRKGDRAKFLQKKGQLCIICKDSHPVTLLTTISDCGESVKRIRSRPGEGWFRELLRPHALNNYYKIMGSVHKVDQVIQDYMHVHRSMKWWKKIFFHVVEVAIVNAHVIYKSYNANKKLDSLNFRTQIIEGLMQEWPRATSRRGRPSSRQDLPFRITPDAHFMKRTEGGAKPDCIVCSDRNGKNGRRQTSFMCRNCNKAMCRDNCFEVYHTVVDLYKDP